MVSWASPSSLNGIRNFGLSEVVMFIERIATTHCIFGTLLGNQLHTGVSVVTLKISDY